MRKLRNGGLVQLIELKQGEALNPNQHPLTGILPLALEERLLQAGSSQEALQGRSGDMSSACLGALQRAAGQRGMQLCCSETSAYRLRRLTSISWLTPPGI